MKQKKLTEEEVAKAQLRYLWDNGTLRTWGK